MNDTVVTLEDYTGKFPEIAEMIRENLDDYGKELDDKNPEDAMGKVMTIMVDIGKMHALQAIALGIQKLANKEN